MIQSISKDEMPALQLNIGDGRIAEYLSGSGIKLLAFAMKYKQVLSVALDLSSEAAFLDRGAALIDRAGNNVLQDYSWQNRPAWFTQLSLHDCCRHE